jgi:hypothetical protein
METGYCNGDKVKYTNEEAPQGFRAFVYMEGHRKGQKGVCVTEEYKDARAAKFREDWQREQAAFRKLRELTKAV